ncbi:MAG: anaerobic ribonucleoside-triphosphate reductase activating protein [Candidatus Bathyarchaeota archaeon]|nr:MAG: anaerobic ribonucleoside-triphosphate reductase activating protein [Candidatus Bathyarchaeota archaeon]
MKLPEIKGFIDLSLVDWDGKVTAVLFLPRCNLRCPFCHNATLVLNPEEMQTIPFEEIRLYLIKNKRWLDGVVITGGEPTIHNDLPILCNQIKELGLKVKLDTNGTNYDLLQELIAKEQVDYIALDIKAPITLERYSNAAGVEARKLMPEVQKTIKLLLERPIDYEFRTTLVPTIHNHEDITLICNEIIGCEKYFLQNFKNDVKTLSPRLANIQSFTREEMQVFLKLARKIVTNTFLR